MVDTSLDEVAVRVTALKKTFTLNHTYSFKDSFVNTFVRHNKEKDNFVALDNVEFDIKKGETFGLVGLNGSGKSTLLKCISGVQKPDKGYIGLSGRVAGLIEVGAGFHPDLTGRENVYLNGAILGMTKSQIDNSYDDIVSFSEVEKFMDTHVRYYSSGMFMRLAFSVAVYSNPDIFLIDEVLSVGDAPFRRKCFKRIAELQKEGKTLVIVSHNQEQIRQVCDKAVWLDHGKMQMIGEVNEVMDAMQNKQKNNMN
jgi:ABC-2 type transport system ATP-binding protein